MRPLGSGRSAAPPDPAAGFAARAFAVTDATTVGARATAPAEYRQMVEEYYRSLAGGKRKR